MMRGLILILWFSLLIAACARHGGAPVKFSEQVDQYCELEEKIETIKRHDKW